MSTATDTVTTPRDARTEYPHIVRRSDVLGGTPVIATDDDLANRLRFLSEFDV